MEQQRHVVIYMYVYTASQSRAAAKKTRKKSRNEQIQQPATQIRGKAINYLVFFPDFSLSPGREHLSGFLLASFLLAIHINIRRQLGINVCNRIMLIFVDTLVGVN
jgi:hypothetical protein